MSWLHTEKFLSNVNFTWVAIERWIFCVNFHWQFAQYLQWLSQERRIRARVYIHLWNTPSHPQAIAYARVLCGKLIVERYIVYVNKTFVYIYKPSAHQCENLILSMYFLCYYHHDERFTWQSMSCVSKQWRTKKYMYMSYNNIRASHVILSNFFHCS